MDSYPPLAPRGTSVYPQCLHRRQEGRDPPYRTVDAAPPSPPCRIVATLATIRWVRHLSAPRSYNPPRQAEWQPSVPPTWHTDRTETVRSRTRTPQRAGSIGPQHRVPEANRTLHMGSPPTPLTLEFGTRCGSSTAPTRNRQSGKAPSPRRYASGANPCENPEVSGPQTSRERRIGPPTSHGCHQPAVLTHPTIWA